MPWCTILSMPLKRRLAAALRLGNLTVDGLGMLLHQACPGFRDWFGTDPEVGQETCATMSWKHCDYTGFDRFHRYGEIDCFDDVPPHGRASL